MRRPLILSHMLTLRCPQPQFAGFQNLCCLYLAFQVFHPFKNWLLPRASGEAGWSGAGGRTGDGVERFLPLIDTDTLCDPMDSSPPSSSVHRVLQARILEWVAIPFSRGYSHPRGWIWVSCITGRFFTILYYHQGSPYFQYPFQSGEVPGSLCLSPPTLSHQMLQISLEIRSSNKTLAVLFKQRKENTESTAQIAFSFGQIHGSQKKKEIQINISIN